MAGSLSTWCKTTIAVHATVPDQNTCSNEVGWYNHHRTWGAHSCNQVTWVWVCSGDSWHSTCYTMCTHVCTQLVCAAGSYPSLMKPWMPEVKGHKLLHPKSKVDAYSQDVLDTLCMPYRLTSHLTPSQIGFVRANKKYCLCTILSASAIEKSAQLPHKLCTSFRGINLSQIPIKRWDKCFAELLNTIQTNPTIHIQRLIWRIISSYGRAAMEKSIRRLTR